ncbi:MAG: hypothetical protein WKF96_17325 [Solirubrobacteraceae bacterium]
MRETTISNRVWRDIIDDLVAEGASLSRIERDVIDPAPLGEGDRSALWLYAWGSLNRQRPLVPA